jgi:hypothetical protein
MTKAAKQEAIAVFGRTYDQMTREASGKRCISRLARKMILEKLEDVIICNHERFQIVRLAMVLADRLRDPRRFDLVDDIDYFDATKDIITCGKPQGWTITSDMEWKWGWE